MNAETAKQILIKACEEYNNYLKSDKGRKYLKRHPMKGKELGRYLKQKFNNQ